jgi:hypothetical protein
MKHIYLLITSFICSLSFGQVVNPISATTTFVPQFSSLLSTCYDGTGLDSYPSAFSNHQGTTPSNSFVGADTAGSIDFDLGGTFDIDGLAFWNQNAGGPNPDIGVNGVNFYSSPDGVTYTLIPGAPTNFSKIMVKPAGPQTFGFSSVSAAFIRMTVTSNHGGDDTGFAEIAFASGGTLSLETTEGNKPIEIYPNPSSDFIQISNLNSNEKYAIYNSVGQKVRSGIVSKNDKIDIQNLTNGFYYIKLENGYFIKFLKE